MVTIYNKLFLTSVLFASIIFSGCTIKNNIKSTTSDKVDSISTTTITPKKSEATSPEPSKTGEESFFDQDQDNDFSAEFDELAKDLQ